MSAYLTVDDTDYVPSGVTLTESLILRASAIIDAYCKREIGVKSYTERIPLTELGKGHVSYYPVLEVTAAKGRPKHSWLGNGFFGPPGFEDIDLSQIDIDKSNGSLAVAFSPFGSPYVELEITYTSGWDPIPENVKVACGMLVSQLSQNTNPNVKMKKDFDFTIEYFGSSMITPEIAGLLSEYRCLQMR